MSKEEFVAKVIADRVKKEVEKKIKADLEFRMYSVERKTRMIRKSINHKNNSNVY